MENMQELIPFAKELLSQKPTRGLLKVYLLGSVLAVLGTVIGLVDTVCHPFSSGEPLDAEMILMMAREQRTMEAGVKQGEEEVDEEKLQEHAHKNEATVQNLTLLKTPTLNQRSIANRLHAS